MVKKLYFPDHLLVTPCTIDIEENGLSEDGVLISAGTWTGKVVFSEKTKRVLTPENQVIVISGQLLLKGNILPSKVISSGTVIVYPDTEYSRKFRVFSCSRNRNPDGTIHSVFMELM